MKQSIFIFSLLAFASCMNGPESLKETQESGYCGVKDKPTSDFPAPDIFKAKCATCHAYERDMTGPKMTGVLDRVPSEKWLREFLTNQDSLVSIDDEYTMEIMNWSSSGWSHGSSNLNSEQLDEMIEYITH